MVARQIKTLVRTTSAASKWRLSVANGREAIVRRVVVSPALVRLPWRRRRHPMQVQWDYPITTVYIDVDDEHSLPGASYHTATGQPQGPHRGFTRIPGRRARARD
jgi:hypothetical protein